MDEVRELKLRFDPVRGEQVAEEVKRLRLSGYSELFRRVWDEYWQRREHNSNEK